MSSRQEDIEALRARLEEAEETLRAIRYNDVDALVISTPEGDRVYTLESAEKPYRVMVESMAEGALTLSPDGVIIYCNLRFAEMAGMRHEKVTALPMARFVPEADTEALQALVASGRVDSGQAEMRLRANDGKLTPVLLTANPLPNQGEGYVCLIVTDLTEQKRNEEVVAAERLARSILENAVEAIVVCDREGKVIRASQTAHRLCEGNALLQPFECVFPLEYGPEESAGAGSSIPNPIEAALQGQTLTGVEARLRRGDRTLHLMLTAGPLRNAQDEALGCVVTLADVTGYKEVEAVLRAHQADIESLNERLRRAMAETHHRVKNNLQVITALVDMHVMSGVDTIPASHLQRLSHHIRSLAVVHDLLTQEARNDQDMEYISASAALAKLKPLLQGMLESSRALQFQVEDVRLPIRQGTSLAVLVNELIANSVKHAEGDIKLTLAVDNNHARLEVLDNGPGFPEGFDPNTAAHTGLDLIESVGRWDLQGEVRYENRPEGGARVVVAFPIGEEAPFA